MTTECIEWPKGKDAYGYGAVRNKTTGKVQKAHRLAWEAKNGPIPDGLDVLHSCDNPGCINEDHLFLGTHADNMADKSRKGRHNKQKLTPNQVREILHLRSVGLYYYQIAERYAVSVATIHATCSGRNNRHIRTVDEWPSAPTS